MAVSGQKAEEKSAMKIAEIGMCGPCETDGEQLEACGFCLDCTDHLCKDCFRSHGKNKASRHHKLLTIAELSTTDVAKEQSRMCFEICDRHTTELVKFYCTEHKTVGCSDCVALEHRTCVIQYIPEEAEGFSDSREYKDTECALENEVKKMTSSLEDVAIIEGKVEDMHKECLKYIEIFHAQLIEHMNKLKDKIMLQVNDKKKKNEIKIKNARSVIQTTLDKALAELQTTGTLKQNSQLFIRTKRVQSLLQSSMIKANEISLEADGMFYQFKESTALQNVLATSDTLGQLISINIEGASFEIPKHWQKMNDKENLKIVALNAQDSEYQQVLNDFKKTLGRNPNIVKIERIQNKTLYTQYAAKHKELNITYPNQKDNERMLWHGTADYAVFSINLHGFNRSYCGKNATPYGQGVYFAVNANYSDLGAYSPVGNDGNKRVYRCLVLTGKYCRGSSSTRVPPPINASQPHILYDSTTDSSSNPIIFVVFNDTQAYPEHLITYK